MTTAQKFTEQFTSDDERAQAAGKVSELADRYAESLGEELKEEDRNLIVDHVFSAFDDLTIFGNMVLSGVLASYAVHALEVISEQDQESDDQTAETVEVPIESGDAA